MNHAIKPIPYEEAQHFIFIEDGVQIPLKNKAYNSVLYEFKTFMLALRYNCGDGEVKLPYPVRYKGKSISSIKVAAFEYLGKVEGVERNEIIDLMGKYYYIITDWSSEVKGAFALYDKNGECLDLDILVMRKLFYAVRRANAKSFVEAFGFRYKSFKMIRKEKQYYHKFARKIKIPKGGVNRRIEFFDGLVLSTHQKLVAIDKNSKCCYFNLRGASHLT